MLAMSLALGLTRKQGGEVPRLFEQFSTPMKNYLTVAEVSSLVSALPTTNLLGLYTAQDLSKVTKSIVNGVHQISAIAKSSGSLSTNIVPETSYEPVLGPDRTICPKFGAQASNQMGMSLDLGSVTNTSKTFYLTVCPANTGFQPISSQDSLNWSIWFGDTATEGNRFFIYVNREHNVVAQRLGTFGSSSATPTIKRSPGWPSVLTVTVTINASGTVAVYYDGVLVLSPAIGNITPLTAANRSLWIGKASGANFFPMQSPVMHVAVYDALHDATTISANAAILNANLTRAQDTTKNLFLAVGDSITSSFRTRFGLCWANYAAHALGWRCAINGRSSRTITSPEYQNGGALDNSGTNDPLVDVWFDDMIATQGGPYNLAVFNIGINNIINPVDTNTAAQLLAPYETFVTARKTAAAAAGKKLKVLACEVPLLNLETVTGGVTLQQEFNTLLNASTVFDGIVPSANMISPFTAADATDTLHGDVDWHRELAARVVRAAAQVRI